MNMSNSLFKGNLPLRQAVNYAIEREPYVGQAGPYAGDTWTHLFNPGVPGWKNVEPLQAEPGHGEEARQGSSEERQDTVYFRSSGTVNPAQAQIVRSDLQAIGFQSGNINMKAFSGGNITRPWASRATTLDMGVSMGWCSDFPDPYDWINVLLYGRRIQADNNVNYSYMNIPKWNKKMASAAKLVGPKRYKVSVRWIST